VGRERKYFVKEDDGIFIVKEDFFKAIGSREEALMVGVRTYFEIQNCLKEEALDGEISFIGNMKVVTGLERTLEKLDSIFPFLLRELHSVERKFEGKTVHKC
jgi:hypothetical protein